MDLPQQDEINNTLSLFPGKARDFLGIRSGTTRCVIGDLLTLIPHEFYTD